MLDTSPHSESSETVLRQCTTAELAQALMEKLSISEKDWHRLKSNRNARAREQAIAALVFLLKDQPEEALPRLQQAVNWLDRSISAPPCPTHGDRPPRGVGQ
ncbi:hypothetical protein H6F43_01750 [Leptolyngbya sp. FACHB-36]|uniref:DUF6439 family protein n=1 Tax=Leptolyngbya sp. FACHB-36 TaxID=2692808 RepID=UPI00168061BC|nr:DUF6439 family protein [Leptolyngbya sp. FACHB-36]MBD2018909.1 hypothetical protein [Leptolyngbya sp. FACHB-36]